MVELLTEELLSGYRHILIETFQDRHKLHFTEKFDLWTLSSKCFESISSYKQLISTQSFILEIAPGNMRESRWLGLKITTNHFILSFCIKVSVSTRLGFWKVCVEANSLNLLHSLCHPGIFLAVRCLRACFERWSERMNFLLHRGHSNLRSPIRERDYVIITSDDYSIQRMFSHLIAILIIGWADFLFLIKLLH